MRPMGTEKPSFLSRLRFALKPGNPDFIAPVTKASHDLARCLPDEIGQEGDLVWIRTHDGLTFFNKPSPDYYWRVYRTLPRAVRSSVPFTHYLCALDRVIRFDGGGLMYGGPKKQRHYTVSPGDIVAEMGAYRGYYAVRLAREVGPEGVVIAIEPHPENVPILRKNVQANTSGNVKIVQKGVWSKPGSGRFHIKPRDGQAGSLILDRQRPHVEVPLDTLDNILAETAPGMDVDLMIIQLNGAEAHALRGMQQHRPRHLAIAARYSPDGVDVAPECVAILQERGYETELLEGGFIFGDLPGPAPAKDHSSGSE
ncbi:MAG: FkbM family methyltransferase [Candidatus Dadabacteria bacterium]|nr:MAG: FkbM family methyltransferase [Candidatus Dadabacteria bacterium]